MHVSQLWTACAIVSKVKSTPQSRAHLYVASLPWWPKAPWARWARNSSPLCCQSKSTWAILFWYSSVDWLFGTWASAWCTITGKFSSQAAISFHNEAAQMALPLHCQLPHFHCFNYPHKAFVTIHESVWRYSTGHFSHSAMPKASCMALISTNWLDSPCP